MKSQATFTTALGAFIILAIAFSVPAFAKRHQPTNQAALDANGNAAGIVRSAKTGATARVSPSHAAKFQAYIDDLEANGASVRFMGGIRRGKCWSGGLHPCGKALDVCQLSRGRVDGRCHLPSRSSIAAIAARHGLFEGGQWCHSDYGHAQVGVSAAPCGGGSMYASAERTTKTYAARRHRRAPQQAIAQPIVPDNYMNRENYR